MPEQSIAVGNDQQRQWYDMLKQQRQEERRLRQSTAVAQQQPEKSGSTAKNPKVAAGMMAAAPAAGAVRASIWHRAKQKASRMYESAADSMDTAMDNPSGTCMWVLAVSFTIFGEMMTLIPFVGHFLSIFFTLIINFIYGYYGFFKRDAGRKLIIQASSGVLEFAISFGFFYGAALLLHVLWPSDNESEED